MNILGICGSLRQASYNMAALRACHDLMPEGMTLRIASIGDLPMYNDDLRIDGLPEPVVRIRSEITAADGLLIATPEYNFSLPPALKNVIDWASLPPRQALQDKPVAIFSCASGPLGGARVQYDLRRILTPLWAYTLPRPEVFIGSVDTKFDARGHLTDETTRRFLAELLHGFRDWVLRMQRSQSGAP